jgi:hypothetical protein
MCTEGWLIWLDVVGTYYGTFCICGHIGFLGEDDPEPVGLLLSGAWRESIGLSLREDGGEYLPYCLPVILSE